LGLTPTLIPQVGIQLCLTAGIHSKKRKEYNERRKEPRGGRDMTLIKQNVLTR